MTFRHFLLVMSAATLAVWLIFCYVLVSIDPTATGATGFLFFHLTLAVAMIGTLTILGTAVRRLFHREAIISRQVSVSFRQGFFLSLLVVAALVLLGNSLLNGWNIMLLTTVLALLELASISSHRQKRDTNEVS